RPGCRRTAGRVSGLSRRSAGVAAATGSTAGGRAIRGKVSQASGRGEPAAPAASRVRSSQPCDEAERRPTPWFAVGAARAPHRLVPEAGCFADAGATPRRTRYPAGAAPADPDGDESADVAALRGPQLDGAFGGKPGAVPDAGAGRLSAAFARGDADRPRR